MTIKLGSLFSGSGGFELAGAINGIEPVWASEIEPYPIRVTKARFPHMKHLGSVLDVDGGKVEPVDIITFGSPCQDLSVAGKQAGLHKGERSNLFFEAIRIIKEMRESTDGKYPRIAVWENVPGAYSSNKGEDFRAVLEAFAQINDEAANVPRPAAGKWNRAGAIVGNGWSIAWRTFDAQFWGVPQRRKRIYLIADFGSERAGEVLFEQEGVRGDFAESGKAGESATDNAEGSVGRSGKPVCILNYQGSKGNSIAEFSDKMYTLNAMHGHDVHVICSATQQGRKAGESAADNVEGSVRGSGVCYAIEPGAAARLNTESRINENICPTLRSNAGDNHPAVCFPVDIIRESRGAFETYEANATQAGSLKQADYKGAQVVAFSASMGAKARGIGYAEEQAPTLSSERHDATVCYPVENHPNDSRVSIREDGIVPTLSSRMGTGGNNGPMVLERALPPPEKPITFSNQAYDKWDESATGSSLRASGGVYGGGSESLVVERARKHRKYIIRRLTPLECCRLQGFPDWWCDGLVTDEPTDEDVAFWREVFETHRKAIGTSTKPKTDNQIIKWLKQPHTDSAEYKMWGNGIALPNAEYVVRQAKRLLTSSF